MCKISGVCLKQFLQKDTLTIFWFLETLDSGIICPQRHMELMTILAAEDTQPPSFRCLQEGKILWLVLLRTTFGAPQVIGFLEKLLDPLLEIFHVCFPHCVSTEMDCKCGRGLCAKQEFPLQELKEFACAVNDVSRHWVIQRCSCG